jgi:DNA-binding transcriptional MocR family regulator
MASPVTVALATRWINDGTGDALLAAVRRESVERQALVRSLLRGQTYRSDPAGFHLWLSLPPPWTRSAIAGHMRATGIGIVPSDAFTTGDTAPEAVRVCLGGPADREQVRDALEFLAHSLAEAPSTASSFL